MQNFKSNIKQITADTLYTGFRAVMRDSKEAVKIAAGMIGQAMVGDVCVMVYGTENQWHAQASVVAGGRVRIVASAEFDNNDI
ncbi:hypothetical protein [Pseudomonas phage vB_PsaM_M1]|nr:hypothetical protein [Pseudomonas phage vB_PsaM_M1]